MVSSLVSMSASVFWLIISESLTEITTYLALINPPSPPTYLKTEKLRLVACREFDPAGSRSHGPLGPVATSHGVTQLLLH